MTFDPIWTADSGDHFSDLVPEPWKHLLCSADDFCEEMSLAGATESQLQEFRYTLNRKPVSVYKSEFPVVLKSLGADSVFMHSWAGCVDEFHSNRFAAAELIGWPPSDLLLGGFSFCIRK